ncbi:TraM-binding TraD/TraG-like protein [Fluviicoccus keumensis]|uniref:TraM-binding TraD/TraG-like protein n=1 Tax=Fluviicoccus keumensis TaxID=1435465 RepID=A0A4Q7ZD21_9GAMM|nr:TraM recognition domain-containing protein [Fluviicoccus keumensis]RZU48114.1 TraM-binding TraD/TraG-like protein [Fluviicoccus keumensis]
MRIETLRKITFAGPADAAALLLWGGGLVLSSSYFTFPSETLHQLSVGLCSAAGAWWLISERLLHGLRERFVLETKHAVRSSEILIAPDDIDAQENALLFGYTVDRGEPLFISYNFLMRHVWILGQSGVGKTVLGTNLMAQQIAKGGGLLFIDGKMNAADLNTMYQLCKWAGREHDLLVINPGNPSTSNSYNPILYGDPDEVASRLLSLIPSSENNPGADYYRQSAKQGITTLVAALQETRLAYNFIDLTILLLNGRALQHLESLLIRDAPSSPVTHNFRLFLDKYKTTSAKGVDIDVNKLRDIFGGIAGRMYDFGTGTFGEVMNTYTPEANIFEAIKANKIVYVMLPTMGKNEQAQNFGKMVVGDLRTAVSWVQAMPEGNRPDPPYMVFADEAGSYVGQSWPRMFEQARSARIWLMPATQTRANFEAISKELEQMITGNTWTKVFFKMGTYETAEAAANIIGKTRQGAISIAQNRGHSASGLELNVSPVKQQGDSSALGITERDEEVYRVHPDQLTSLDMGECMVSFGGDRLYHIRVPLISVSPTLQEACGETQVNHFHLPSRKGINLFSDINRWLSDMVMNRAGNEE